MSGYEQIGYAVADGIATITLNRPDRLNARTPVVADEDLRAVGAAGADKAARRNVITGAGRGSVQPADTGFEGAPGPDLGDLCPGRFGYLGACPKPVIAAINGPCAGIGLILTHYCDLRFAVA